MDPQCHTSSPTTPLAHLLHKATQTTIIIRPALINNKDLTLTALHKVNMVPRKVNMDNHHHNRVACTTSKDHRQEDTKTTEEEMEVQVAV